MSVSSSTVQSRASKYDNPERAHELYDQLETEKRNERAQAVENLTTKQWLETKLEDQAQPYDVLGREFLFKPIGTERVEEILELASEEAQKVDDVDGDNLDDVDPEDMQDMPKLLRTMRETLGEHCLDEDMDASAFGKLPMDVLQETFEDVAMGEGLSDNQADRARRFRGE